MVNDFTPIDNVTTQNVVISNLEVDDGDMISITIQSVDIMTNELSDATIVYFDSSPPELKLIGEFKNDKELL